MCHFQCYGVMAPSVCQFCRSDGLQPHLINVQFQQKVPVSVGEQQLGIVGMGSLQGDARCMLGSSTVLQEVRLYLDYKLDESYTPNKLSIRAGSSFQDLKVGVTYTASAIADDAPLEACLPVT